MLPEGKDTIFSVPVRAGELAALQHLVHFGAMNIDLREVAVLLIADLKARAVPTVDKNYAQVVTAHSAGVEQVKQARRKHPG
ncbi:hypothetical protein [Streptomyces flaveolus]|uniref:hypothetical protein n=1 Tax=Streptomyces flaveolus TaxID=67297 RepID=UPI0033C54379